MSLSDRAMAVDLRPPSTILPTIDFVQREIRRVGASEGELRRAMNLLAAEGGLSQRDYAALSKRMRRLLDLLALASPASRDQLTAAEPVAPLAIASGEADAIVVPLRRPGSMAR